jgi:hypothetical protein
VVRDCSRLMLTIYLLQVLCLCIDVVCCVKVGSSVILT